MKSLSFRDGRQLSPDAADLLASQQQPAHFPAGWQTPTAAADALTVFCIRNTYDCCKLHGDLKVKGSVVHPAGETVAGLGA